MRELIEGDDGQILDGAEQVERDGVRGLGEDGEREERSGRIGGREVSFGSRLARRGCGVEEGRGGVVLSRAARDGSSHGCCTPACSSDYSINICIPADKCRRALDRRDLPTRTQRTRRKGGEGNSLVGSSFTSLKVLQAHDTEILLLPCSPATSRVLLRHEPASKTRSGKEKGRKARGELRELAISSFPFPCSTDLKLQLPW